jgi:hypothetical protein
VLDTRTGGTFSVKSTYLVLDKRAMPQRILSGEDIENLARVWDSWASPKVIVFSWQLLQDRIPTRQNLRRRRVLVGTTDTSCAFCGAVGESVDHLFVSCDRISPAPSEWPAGTNGRVRLDSRAVTAQVRPTVCTPANRHRRGRTATRTATSVHRSVQPGRSCRRALYCQLRNPTDRGR